MSSARPILATLVALSLNACAGMSDSTPAQQSAAATPASTATQASTPSAPAAERSDLPPIPVTAYPAARPPEIVRAVFTFAADHPEVLSKVPCFCGCENRGHKHNDDCFVAARDAKGRVTAWDPHGVG